MNNFRRRLKMFKKIAGLFLAAAVMCSSAAITASAAEAEDDAAVAAAGSVRRGFSRRFIRGFS